MHEEEALLIFYKWLQSKGKINQEYNTVSVKEMIADIEEFQNTESE